MSFWSSLIFARAAPPPIVTAQALGAFVRELAATGALVEKEPLACQLKYGRRVDRDERTTEGEWEGSDIIRTLREFPWDRSETFPSLTAMSDHLARDGKKIYRAYLDLGDLHPEIVAALTREASEENTAPMRLNGASFGVGPVMVHALDSDAPGFAGWMEFCCSGPGHYYPWPYRQARERAESVERLRRVVEICSRCWPVTPAPPSKSAIAARRRLPDLWLYDDFDLPSDWLWFASETG